MKKRIKSLIALMLTVLLFIQTGPVPVYAVMRISSAYTLETDESSDGYIVSSGGVLTFKEGLTVNGNVELEGGYDNFVNELIIPDTATMNGTISMTNLFDQVENRGTISSDLDLSAGIMINYADMAGVTVDGSGILYAKDGSSYTTLDLRNAGSGAAVTDGELSVETVYMDAYAFSGDGSDTTMNVSGHFSFNGTTELPDNMKVTLGETTKITTEGQENISVYYGGEKYILPQTILSAVTLSEIFSGTTNRKEVTYAELPIGYQNTEPVGIVVGNDGLADISVHITQDDEWSSMFSVVMDMEEIATEAEFGISKEETIELLVMPKPGLKTNTYTGTMQIEFCTEDGVVFQNQTISGTADVQNIPSIDLPAGEYYSLSGTEGKNGFYKSDVVLQPAEGYFISSGLNGTFTETLTYEATTDEPSFYLMKTSTGQITDKATISGIKIDKNKPVITGGEDDTTYYTDSLSIKVTDDNLSSVSVNDEEKEVANQKSEFTIGGEDDLKKYTITAEDLAGNVTELSLKISPEWRKDGNVPGGKKIRLYKNKKYTLESGTWTVNDDSTVYMGENDFYVTEDGQYTFTESD